MDNKANTVVTVCVQAADSSKEKTSTNHKWKPEHLQYAFGLLDQGRTLKQSVNETSTRFSIPAVSVQYVSRRYKENRKAGKKMSVEPPISQVTESQPASPDEWWKSRDTFVDRLAKLTDQAVQTVDTERSARTGAPVKVRRYFGEAVDSARLVGKAAGYLENPNVQAQENELAKLRAQLDRKTVKEILDEIKESYLPFMHDQNVIEILPDSAEGQKLIEEQIKDEKSEY